MGIGRSPGGSAGPPDSGEYPIEIQTGAGTAPVFHLGVASLSDGDGKCSVGLEALLVGRGRPQISDWTPPVEFGLCSYWTICAK